VEGHDLTAADGEDVREVPSMVRPLALTFQT
jgi:hypothetical protein